MEEEYKDLLHIKFPEFLKEFLNKFVNTKFYIKTLKDRKEFYDKHDPDYLFIDWKCLNLDGYEYYTDEEKITALLSFGQFGLIPNYQHDKLKAITIDFKNKVAWLTIGMATKPYASYVLQHKQNIPKYMQPLVDELFINYDRYIIEKCL